MPLTSGLRLGPYEIIAPLGAGGMGEVYRARDTRLDRTVAVKVLPAELAANPELRQRLEREARAVSALNHPHICTLYDIGHQDGIDYLVMEFLEGETLAARLSRGPLPLDQVLRYALEIAGALAAAHRQAVFHRDLKPGNIMLTRTGSKLLDFGLAKVGVGRQGLGVGDATISRELTQKGSILGTLQYMAPEQLQGEPTDARTDLFAFGAVVYEMVTGRKAFEGSSQASVIAAILEREPPAIGSSGALDRIVGRCLAKDPEERWQTARDLASELQWIAGGGGVAAPVPSSGRSRERVAWGLAAILLVVAVGLAVLRLRGAPPVANDTPVFRFPVAPPEKATFPGTAVALSPDGARLAFLAVSEGRMRLWVRSLDSLAAQPVADTDNPLNHVFWSPDARYLAFCAQGKLKKVEVTTGRVETLCDTSSLIGGSWSGEDVILFVPNGISPVYRVAASGGVASPVTALDRSRATVGHFWPQFLPDGRRFLYSVLSGKEEYTGTYVGSLDRPAESQDARPLVNAMAALYAPPGYLLFPRDSDLYARPFDLARLRVTGEPRLLAARAGGVTMNRILPRQ